jgi:hypothetical protein
MMHGAYTAKRALHAGVLDLIDIQLRPVLWAKVGRDTPPRLLTCAGSGSGVAACSTPWNAPVFAMS